MPSYTASLKLIQPSAGEYPGTWGTEVNNRLTALVDKAVAGTTSITMTAANYTLTNADGVADEAKSMFLVLGGTPGASYAVIVPSASKLYFVTNNTGFAQTVRTSGTGISVPNGASMTLRCDGTNVVVAQNYFASMTLGSALPVASGGTGSTSTTYCSLTTNVTGTLPVANGGTGSSSAFTANGIVYASSTAALATSSGLTYNGTNFATTGTVSATKLIPTGGSATGNGMYLPTTNTLAWSTNGSERMRLDASGTQLINLTSIPGDWGTAPRIAVRQAVSNLQTGVVVFSSGSTDNAIFIGHNGSVGAIGTNTGGLGGSQTPLTFYTSTVERARITDDGEFYIAGTTDQGDYNLQVNGTGVWGAGAYVNGSDERLKEDIVTIDAALDVVTSLRPVTFRYKKAHSKDQKIQPGFIAQELQTAMAGKAYVDGVVHSGPEYLNVAYQSLIPLLTKAVQEQQALITALTARVTALEQA